MHDASDPLAEPAPATTARSGRAFGPASLSNLGPGFDALGLCIDGAGDTVHATIVDGPGVRITSVQGDAGLIPTAAAANTASVAAAAVLEAAGSEHGLALRIEKNVPYGSGIGGSAASAVAGAWAANLALGRPFGKEELVEAVLAGEAIASGARHGDNVLPALFGGLVLVSSSDPSRYRRIPLPGPLPLAIIAPDIQVLTRHAREILPRTVGLRDAVHNAAELAFLVDAFRCGDWATVGRCIMADRLVEPVRARLVTGYDEARNAALEAGALGCALTGSGPAMFAIAATPAAAGAVMRAVVDTFRAAGTGATGFVTEANPHGVRRAG